MVNVKKIADKEKNVRELPTITDKIFKLKIDRETQKLYVEGKEDYGLVSELTIRPLDMYNKIVAYNEDFEVTTESTFYHELKEARDSRGNAATDKFDKETGKGAAVCGRVIWKNVTDTFSDEKKEINKSKAKFYTYIFGIANIKGQPSILVDFRVGGTKFMEVINLLKKIKEEKKEYNKAEIRIIAKPSEDYDWPELEFMADFSSDLPVTGLEPFFDTIEAYVQYHNAGVDKKVKKYQEQKENKNTGYNKGTTYKRK